MVSPPASPPPASPPPPPTGSSDAPPWPGDADPRATGDAAPAVESALPDTDPVVEALRRCGPRLLSLAAEVIARGIAVGQPPAVDLAREPAALRAPGAAFVTLTDHRGALRGCIGSVVAHQSLAQDVAANAWAAATRDPRFRPVTAAELPGLALSVSLLSTPRPLPVTSEADLLARLRPGVDGVILSDRGRRGLFLPQVWETLPEPRLFLLHLKRKAGLADTHWSPTLTVERFEARSIKDPQPWRDSAPADIPSQDEGETP